MKRTARVTVRLLTIAVMATIGLGMSAGRAVAQTKNPLAPQLVRNIDEPGFNPYQHSQNVTIGPVSATAFFPIPTSARNGRAIGSRLSPTTQAARARMSICTKTAAGR